MSGAGCVVSSMRYGKSANLAQVLMALTHDAVQCTVKVKFVNAAKKLARLIYCDRDWLALS